MAEIKSMDDIRAAHQLRMAEYRNDAKQREREDAAEREHSRQRATEARRQAELLEHERVLKCNEKIYDLIRAHANTLTRKYLQFTAKDDYGLPLFSIDRWAKEKDYFIDRVIYPQIGGTASKISREHIAQLVQNEVDANVRRFSDRATNTDAMSGVEYEFYCAELLMKSGWKTSTTRASGDQGVDVIAEKGRIVLALQCKNYSSSVGNAAIQEVYAGMRFVNATHGAVVSPTYYTPQAQHLAQSTDIYLLHHTDLCRIEIILGNSIRI